MKLIRLLFMVLLISILCGCGNEPNDLAYVSAMGIDKMDNSENLKITIQFARTSQISGGASEEGGKEGENIIDNVSVEASDIYSGIGLANQIVSKQFSLSHAKLIVFSEEVAKEGIKEIVDTLIRSNEIRPDVYFAVSINGAEEYLEQVRPVIELNPIKYYQLTYEKNTSSGLPKNTTEDFYFKESSSKNGAVMAVAGFMEEGDEQSKENDEEINTGGFEYKIKNYLAGDVALSEENKSETIGMAVFKDFKLVEIFGSIDTEIYGILSGQHKADYTSFYSRKSPDAPVTVKINQRRKPKIKLDLENETVNIKLFLEADLYTVPYDYDIDDFINEFEEEASKEINYKCVEFLKKTRDKYDTDIIGIGNKAKMKFLTYDDFESYDWNSKFRNFEINVDTSFKIRRTGLIIKENG